MTQNRPMRVTYIGRRAKGEVSDRCKQGSDGPRNAGVQGRLGFRERKGAVKGQKWPILGLKPVPRRDVRGHVAT